MFFSCRPVTARLLIVFTCRVVLTVLLACHVRVWVFDTFINRVVFVFTIIVSYRNRVDPNTIRKHELPALLEMGIDRHTLSVLIALYDLGLNPEALAAVVKELRRETLSMSPTVPPPSSS